MITVLAPALLDWIVQLVWLDSSLRLICVLSRTRTHARTQHTHEHTFWLLLLAYVSILNV